MALVYLGVLSSIVLCPTHPLLRAGCPRPHPPTPHSGSAPSARSRRLCRTPHPHATHTLTAAHLVHSHRLAAVPPHPHPTNKQTLYVCPHLLTYSAYVPQAQGRTPHTHSLSATQTALLAPLSLSLCTPPLTHSLTLCCGFVCPPTQYSLTHSNSLTPRRLPAPPLTHAHCALWPCMSLLAPLSRSLSLHTPTHSLTLSVLWLCVPPHTALTHSLKFTHSLHAGCLRPHSLTLTLHCGHVCAPARTHSGQPNPHSEQAVRAPTLHNYYGGYNCTPLPIVTNHE